MAKKICNFKAVIYCKRRREVIKCTMYNCWIMSYFKDNLKTQVSL